MSADVVQRHDGGQRFALQPLLITVAPNGARRTKADHDGLPLTAREIAETASDCVAAGAAMIHLHVRDREGRHTLDADAYREAIDAVRERVGDGIVIQITTEAVGVYKPREQFAVVREIEPEAVSLAIKEVVPPGGENEAGDFCVWAAEKGVFLQWILYSQADVVRYKSLQDAGVILRDNDFLLFVLGRYATGGVSDPRDLIPFLAEIDRSAPWAVSAFGGSEYVCAGAGLMLGGHVRVGFENNLHLKDGTLANDNASLVADVARLAGAIGRPVMDAETARRWFRSLQSGRSR